MKKVSVLVILFFTVLYTAGQQVRFPSDAQKLIKKIDANTALKVYNAKFNNCDSLCLHEPERMFTYFVDSLNGRVHKVAANEIATQTLRTYYFNNERLVGVKECSDVPDSIATFSFFTDGLLSVGTTYKDGLVDAGVWRRKSLLADAYLILLHSKSLAIK